MEIQYGDLNQLHWLWLIGAVVLLYALSSLARRRAARRFATANLLARIVPPRGALRQAVSCFLVTGAIALLAVALVDVRWGKVEREVPQRGIEVVFLLDVSRSMLAEDVTPNRLERAKQQIKDMLEVMSGDRVALVLFAGETRQHVPMTSHYEHFKQSLALVGPHNVRRGGSRLGDAIRVAQDSFLSQTNDHKAIVILTDGEDQESGPVEAAQNAHAEDGIRIFTVGLGDFESGARIPIESNNRRSFLRYDGQQVWSKLNGKILREIAAQSEGAYIPAGTKQVDMADVYQNYIAKVEQTEFEVA
ncbi:MAG: VWA domain-containing protein, partial [Pirellulales bacterium]|nr:VWA domain-containing protein [Pirellulales bacterium]